MLCYTQRNVNEPTVPVPMWKIRRALYVHPGLLIQGTSLSSLWKHGLICQDLADMIPVQAGMLAQVIAPFLHKVTFIERDTIIKTWLC